MVSAVVLDLDGLILDTETLCVEVASEVCARHGKALTLEAKRAALGKRPLECWEDVAKVLGITASAQQLLDESEPLLESRWGHAPILPGALRLLRHLDRTGVPFGIATSTPRATFVRKLEHKEEVRRMLQGRPVVCGDEVQRGKPHPDVFIEACRQLGVSCAESLVLEDAPSGVQGATAAGCRVVVVPSLVGCEEYGSADPSARSGVVEIMPSLLCFAPASYGLPPFDDLLPPGGHPGGAVIPMDRVFRIRGRVVPGFGRGSKELGIPTANIDASVVARTLSEAVTGIYAGWARIGQRPEVYKTVLSLGWNPHFKNERKTCEPWLLAPEPLKPFYGETLSLLVCGFVRPEASFQSLEALIERIHADADVARCALELAPLQAYSTDAFLLEDVEA